MSVTNALNTGMYSKLTGASALTALLASGSAVYYQQAPDYASYPYVVFSIQAGGPENDNPHDSRDMLYYVRGYATKPALAGSVDAQISTALHRQTLTVSGWTNIWTVREEEIALVEQLSSGERVYSAGATYRIWLDN